MSKLIRALLISTVATGVAAVVWQAIRPAAPPAPAPRRPRAGDPVEADALPPDQRDLLLRELDAQL